MINEFPIWSIGVIPRNGVLIFSCSVYHHIKRTCGNCISIWKLSRLMNANEMFPRWTNETFNLMTERRHLLKCMMEHISGVTCIVISNTFWCTWCQIRLQCINSVLHGLFLKAAIDIYIYIYIYAFSRCFYPKGLTLHSSYSFYILSALAFPGNRTHDLGIASAMLYQLSYRKAVIDIKFN